MSGLEKVKSTVKAKLQNLSRRVRNKKHLDTNNSGIEGKDNGGKVGAPFNCCSEAFSEERQIPRSWNADGDGKMSYDMISRNSSLSVSMWDEECHHSTSSSGLRTVGTSDDQSILIAKQSSWISSRRSLTIDISECNSFDPDVYSEYSLNTMYDTSDNGLPFNYEDKVLSRILPDSMKKYEMELVRSISLDTGSCVECLRRRLKALRGELDEFGYCAPPKMGQVQSESGTKPTQTKCSYYGHKRLKTEGDQLDLLDRYGSHTDLRIPYSKPQAQTNLRRRLLDGRDYVNILNDVKGEKFIKLRRVGHGHSSVVYQAMNVRTLEQVAIKDTSFNHLAGKNEVNIMGLEMELDALRRQCLPPALHQCLNCSQSDAVGEVLPCNHPCPNRVNFYGMILEDNLSQLAGLVLEYAEFGTLADWARARYPITEPFLAHVAHCSLIGLKYIQSWGFLHKDIKPKNILLVIDVNGCIIAKIADFGISSPVNARRSLVAIGDKPTRCTSMSAAGTKRYMPPEALRFEEMEHRSDIYSLGVTLTTLANGGMCPVPHCEPEFEQITHAANAEYEIMQWGSSSPQGHLDLEDSFSPALNSPGGSNGESGLGLSGEIDTTCMSTCSYDGGERNSRSGSCYKPDSQLWMWDKVKPIPSIEARSFFSCCAKSDVALRPSVYELLHHPFLKKKKGLHWTEVQQQQWPYDPQLIKKIVNGVIEGQMDLCGSSTSIDSVDKKWSQLPGFPGLVRTLGMKENELEMELQCAYTTQIAHKLNF